MIEALEAQHIVMLASIATSIAVAEIKDLERGSALLAIQGLCTSVFVGMHIPFVESIPPMVSSVIIVPSSIVLTIRHLPKLELERPLASPIVLGALPALLLLAHELGLALTTSMITLLSLVSIYVITTKRNLLKIIFGLVMFKNSLHAYISHIAHIGLLFEILVSSVFALTVTLALYVVVKAFKITGSMDSSELRRLRW